MPELHPFRMPSLGADMDEGTILEWRVAVGDAVKRGQLVALVQTEKADLDVEVFEDGVVQELCVGVGEKVPVGTVLALLAPAGATVKAPAAVAEPVVVEPVVVEPVVVEPVLAAAPVTHAEPVLAAVVAAPVSAAAAQGHTTSPVVRHLAERLGVSGHLAGSGPGGRVTRHDVEVAAESASHEPRRRRGGRAPVSPRARRLARQAGLDVAVLTGTGPAGAVVGADVLAARSAPAAPTPTPPAPTPAAAEAATVAPAPAAAAPAAATADRRQAMRQAIGRRMEKAWREIPHFHVATRIDLHEAMAWLEQANLDRPVTNRLLPAALLLRAAAVGAAKVPDLNGWWVDGTVKRAERVDVGVVVSLRGGGLLTPVITDAAAKDVDTIMAELRDLTTRTRANRLRAADLVDGSITVTNLGEQGVEVVHGVIQPPQLALVGFGTVHDEPVAIDGLLGIRPVVVASLAVDHRAADGLLAARLLRTIDDLLQHPEAL